MKYYNENHSLFGQVIFQVNEMKYQIMNPFAIFKIIIPTNEQFP